MLPEAHYAAQSGRVGLLYKTLYMRSSSINPSHLACNQETKEDGIQCEHHKVPIVIATPYSETQPEPMIVQMQQLSGTNQEYLGRGHSQTWMSDGCIAGNRHTANLPTQHSTSTMMWHWLAWRGCKRCSEEAKTYMV